MTGRVRAYRRLLRISAFALIGGVSLACATPAKAQPITIDKKRDMKFGTFASDVSGSGTVVLNPNADQTTLTGPLFDFGGTVRRARFQIIGDAKAWVIVTLPSSITIRKGTSGNAMTVDTFTMDVTNPVRLNNSGKKTINIGATLRVTTNQTAGNYNDDNEFTIDVDYQ